MMAFMPSTILEKNHQREILKLSTLRLKDMVSYYVDSVNLMHAS